MTDRWPIVSIHLPTIATTAVIAVAQAGTASDIAPEISIVWREDL
jgi:hypothetical protein